MRTRLARLLLAAARRLDEGAVLAERRKDERDPFPRLYVLFGSLAGTCWLLVVVATTLGLAVDPGFFMPAVGIGVPGVIVSVFAGACWAEHT